MGGMFSWNINLRMKFGVNTQTGSVKRLLPQVQLKKEAT
jgi:hypothetical protein